MFENIKYTSNGYDYLINGDAPDLVDDLAHKVLFSIENITTKATFSYNIGISHQLWDSHWNIHPNAEPQINTLKEIYLEKVKRLIDSKKEEYIDVTLTPLNTPTNIDEALKSFKH